MIGARYGIPSGKSYVHVAISAIQKTLLSAIMGVFTKLADFA